MPTPPEPILVLQNDGPGRRIRVKLRDTVQGHELVFRETVVIGGGLPDRVDTVALFLPELVALVAGVGRASYAPDREADVAAQALLLRMADLTRPAPDAPGPDAPNAAEEFPDAPYVDRNDALRAAVDAGLPGVLTYYNLEKGRRRKRRRGCRDTLAKLVVEAVLVEFAYDEDDDGVSGVEESCKHLESAADQLRRVAEAIGRLL